MKVTNRKSLMTFLTLSLALTLIASCGKKNKTNSDEQQTVGFSNNAGPQTGVQYSPSPSGADIQQIASSFQCRYGTRLSQYATFNVQGGYGNSGNRTTIQGQFNPGPQGGGQRSKAHVGVSAFGDVMIVYKISNGAQVVGYEVALSMCSYSQNQLPLIDNSRQIQAFQASRGIIIDNDNNCGYGSVDAALETSVVSAATTFNYNGHQVQLQPFNAVTTFYKPGCNGQY